MADTRGLPLLVMVTPALLRDRDAAYGGKPVTWAKQHLNLTIETVSRPKDSLLRLRGTAPQVGR